MSQHREDYTQIPRVTPWQVTVFPVGLTSVSFRYSTTFPQPDYSTDWLSNTPGPLAGGKDEPVCKNYFSKIFNKTQTKWWSTVKWGLFSRLCVFIALISIHLWVRGLVCHSSISSSLSGGYDTRQHHVIITILPRQLNLQFLEKRDSPWGLFRIYKRWTLWSPSKGTRPAIISHKY